MMIWGQPMLTIHLPTLLLATAIVATAQVLLVLSMRVGLGANSRGVRTWLAGDVLILLGQGDSMLVTALFNITLPPTITASAMLTAGVALHLVGIRRHLRQPTADDLTWLLAAPSLGIVVGMATWVMSSAEGRAVLLYGLLISMIGFNLVQDMWAERRFLGVRMTMATLVLAILANVSQLLFAFTSHAPHGHETLVGMLLSLVMPLLTTSSFMLWLQEELRESLQRMAQTDALTGAYNRHGLLPLVEVEFQRARRHSRALSIAVCDIDRFKAINDRLGHAGGDHVLSQFAAELKAHVRATDLVGRWGGEEFLVVLPETSTAGAAVVLERLRARPAGAPLDAQGRVTFSAGVASTEEIGGLETVDSLIARADARLYLAKVPRDAVVVSDGPIATST